MGLFSPMRRVLGPIGHHEQDRQPWQSAAPTDRATPGWSDRSSARPRTPSARGCSARQRLDLPRQCLQRLVLLLLRREFERRIALGRQESRAANSGADAAIFPRRPPAAASSLSSFCSAVSSRAKPAARSNWSMTGYSAELGDRASTGSAGRCAARPRCCSRSTWVNRDLPMPGSPQTSTTWPSPSRPAPSGAAATPISSSRPTRG